MVFEKARELAQLLIDTKESQRLQQAKAAFESDAAAKAQMEAYKDFQKDIQTQMENGMLTREEFMEASKDLRMLGRELKKNAIIGELIEAENQFNQLINQTVDLIRYTITGEEPKKGCGGGCGGCH